MFRKAVLTLIMMLAPALFIEGAGKRFTLVIDAGHGGYDSGAKGAISYEKNLTLRYALAFGKTVEKRCPDVKVVYTRKTDKFLPLHVRARIANDNRANLFISFHINALEPGHISRGFQSYTLGAGQRTGTKGIRENMEVARRENSVIFMEKDYKQNYKGLENSAESDIMFEFIADKNRERSVELSRLMQREVCKATGRHNGGSHQNNLAVLRLTSMPAILLELGFISTPDEEAFLNTDSALALYTRGIFNAFVAYKGRYGGSITVPFREGEVPQVASHDNDNESRPKAVERDGAASDDKAREDDNKTRRRRNDNEQRRRPAVSQVQQAVDSSRPVFKVQIFSGRNKLPQNSPLFKGLKGCDSYEEGSYIKYTYGASNNYNIINRLRKEILDRFPQAFVIAFKNGKKIDVNEGIREFLDNKHKGRSR